MAGKGYRKGKLFVTKVIAVDKEVMALVDQAKEPGERANDTLRKLLGLNKEE